MNKSFFIETFGCQMNKSDSELMALSLSNAGYQRALSANSADILVFNTCSVREHAENRALSRIKSIGDRIKTDRIIVVSGCMAQRIGEKLLDEKIADLVIGPFQSPRIAEIIKSYLDETGNNIFTSQADEDFENRINFELAYSKDTLPWHKWVTITHGCNNYCSYCIVPYVRGMLISLRSEYIIEYIEILAANEISEITLLGQNVNQYGIDNGDIPFHILLKKAAAIKNLSRINFLTSHPKDFNENIIHVIKDNEDISKNIHLPLQSGSDRILKLMNRNYTIRHFLDIVEKIDKILDNYSISTDIIVGFPGESEDDFNSTLKVLDIVGFDEAFMYAYSPRQGTSASHLNETISRAEKMDRLNTLINTQRKLSRRKLNSRLNCTEEMIAERISKKLSNEIMGKTFLNHPVVIPGQLEDIGRKIKIKITSIKGSTLYGKRIA